MIDFNNVTDIMLGQNQVTQIEDSFGNVLWSATPAVEYFYVEDISGTENTLSIVKQNSGSNAVEVFYSIDQTNWTSMGTTDTTPITATVPANSKLYLKCNSLFGNTYQGNIINCSGRFNVGGYLMSLSKGDNFENASLTGFCEFMRLFSGSTNIINANKLILPQNITSFCYQSMFNGCSNLTTAPVLPATTLSEACYSSMFSGCTSLTTAPELPATSLATSCYYEMFKGCTSLTTVPAILATTAGSASCRYMFQNCTSLVTPPTMSVTTLADNCFRAMFSGCTSLTTAPELPATSLTTSCYSNMFSGCTSLTTAPELPATSLATNCYFNMFINCSLINSITTYANNISATDCLANWLSGVSATGDFYNLGGATYPTGISGIPSGWTEHTIKPHTIRYTTTDNQQQNFNTTGLTVLSHTFTNGIGEMVLDPSTLTLPQYFANNNTLATIEFGDGILFTNQYVLASTNETTSLTSVTFPSDLTYIGQRVVRKRKGITTLDIPATVTSIDGWIGWYSSLQSVICRATTPPTIATETFIIVEPYTISQTNIVQTVYVPANSVTAYQTASVWSNYVAAGMQILPIQ